MDIQNAVLEKIRIADRAGANALLDEWTSQHDYNQLMIDVIEPILATISDQFTSGQEWSISQAYVAAKVTEDMLEKFAENSPQNIDSPELKGPIVIGNIEDDYHAIGRSMVSTYLRANGWLVYDLGNDISADEFVDKAIEVGAKIIGASAMMYATSLNIKLLREEIDKRGLTGRVQLAVGGSAFVLRPELVQEVGGDGTSINAINAPKLFDNLLKKALAAEERRGK